LEISEDDWEWEIAIYLEDYKSEQRQRQEPGRDYYNQLNGD